jgi:hypothetical protein
MNFILLLLLSVGCLCKPLDYSRLCIPVDDNVDLFGRVNVLGSSSNNAEINVAKNWWYIDPSLILNIYSRINVGGYNESATLRTMSLAHAIPIIIQEINEANCDNIIIDDSPDLLFTPGVTCLQSLFGGGFERNIIFDGLNQTNPKFVISFRMGSTGDISMIVKTLAFQNGASLNSSVIWSSPSTLEVVWKLADGVSMLVIPGTIIADHMALVSSSAGAVRFNGQILVFQYFQTQENIGYIYGEPSQRLPVCSFNHYNLTTNSNSTIENMRVTKNTDDLFSTLILVNGDVASATPLDESVWLVNGNQFIANDAYVDSKTYRFERVSNISRIPCTRLIAVGGFGTLEDSITIYPWEVVCFNSRYTLFRGDLIFDAQGNKNAVFILRTLEVDLESSYKIQKRQYLNGSKDENVHIIGITYLGITGISPTLDDDYQLGGHIQARNLFTQSNFTIHGDIFSWNFMQTNADTYWNIQPPETDNAIANTPTADNNTTNGNSTQVFDQTSCATQSRQCSAAGKFDFTPFTFSSLDTLNSASIYYEVTTAQETPNITLIFRWAMANGSVSATTQPSGSWTLSGARNAPCDNTTVLYTARFTSTFAVMYEWFNGAPHGLSPVISSLVERGGTLLQTSGTLYFGSNETSQCTVRLDMKINPATQFANSGLTPEVLLGSLAIMLPLFIGAAFVAWVKVVTMPKVKYI